MDFRSFFDFVINHALTQKLSIIEIIHGKGKGPDGLPFLPELMDQKLRDLDEVSYLERYPGNPGMVCVHLSLKSVAPKQNSNPFQSLKKALDLDPAKVVTRQSDTLAMDSESQLDCLWKLLETDWDEDRIMKVLNSIERAGNREMLDKAIKELQAFEVFFTPSFKGWLKTLLQRLSLEI